MKGGDSLPRPPGGPPPAHVCTFTCAPRSPAGFRPRPRPTRPAVLGRATSLSCSNKGSCAFLPLGQPMSRFSE